MSFPNSYSLTSFSIWMSFIPFSYMMALGRTPELCWIKVTKVGIIAFFQILERKLSASNYLVLFWFIIMRNIPFLSYFFSVFFLKEMLDFIKSLFWILWGDNIIFILHSVDVVYHINWFVYIEPFTHSWYES
jgi:hypothetical protein